MNTSIQPYPSIRVFILFAVVALLIGFIPIFLLMYILNDLSPASPEKDATVLLLQIILPAVLLADFIIVKNKIYRENNGILVAMIICILSCIAGITIFDIINSVIKSYDVIIDIEFIKIMSAIFCIPGAIAGWLTAFFTLPAKPIPPEER